jgi:hypothetical protein
MRYRVFYLGKPEGETILVDFFVSVPYSSHEGDYQACPLRHRQPNPPPSIDGQQHEISYYTESKVAVQFRHKSMRYRVVYFCKPLGGTILVGFCLSLQNHAVFPSERDISELNKRAIPGLISPQQEVKSPHLWWRSKPEDYCDLSPYNPGL